MIFGRYAFIIVYLALSALNPSSARAASNIADLADTRERIAPRPTTINRQQSILLSTVARPRNESKPLLKRSPNSVETLNSAADLAAVSDANDSKSLEASDIYWALGAMTLTFGISLFLIWLLFKEPSPSRKEIAVADRDSESAKETAVKNNPVIEEAIASSATNLESDRSVLAQQAQNSPRGDVDAVRVIQELQSEVAEADSNHRLSSDGVAQIAQRREAIWKLTETGDYRSIGPLLKIMAYADEPDKTFIITAVTQIINRTFKPIDEQLFTNLQDANPEVRLNAIRDLKNLYQFVTPVITKIAQMQSDVDYGVRQTAIQALEQLNANPFPTFPRPTKTTEQKTDNLVLGEESEANLHLVAYLLAELDAEKQC